MRQPKGSLDKRTMKKLQEEMEAAIRWVFGN
jgi:hypothetical protein